MRPLYPVSIILMLSACGRLGFDGRGDGDSSDQLVSGDGIVEIDLARAPYVCASQQWTGIGMASPDVDLSVVPTPTGATVMWVPTSGGSLRGFELDAQLALVGSATTILAGTYTASGGAYLDGALIAAVVSNPRTIVQIVQPGLASSNEIANVDGIRVAKTAALHAGQDRITTTASSCTEGLLVNPYDASWNVQPYQLHATNTTTALAAAQAGAQALSVWSTDSECNFQLLSDATSGTGGVDSMLCPRVQLATNGADTAMVFENGAGAALSRSAANALTSTGAVLIEAGSSSPRVAFDGDRFWVGYLDSTGELVIGYLAGDGLLATHITGITPQNDAYALAVINGKVWVMNAAGAGVAAHKLCI